MERLLTVARLVPHKGQDTVLHALATLARDAGMCRELDTRTRKPTMIPGVSAMIPAFERSEP
jgi:hypothetical protein